MSINVDVEGYEAEKHFRHLNRIDKNQLRNDRKHKKQERLAILEKIKEHENQLCDKCKGKLNKHKCDCPASLAIQDLGKRLGWEEGQTGRPKWNPVDDFTHITPETFTVEIYHEMKIAKLTDRDVFSLLGWYSAKLYEWKREQGLLVGKTRPTRQTAEGQVNEVME